MSITNTQIKKTCEQKTESVYAISSRLRECGIGRFIDNVGTLCKLTEGIAVLNYIKTIDGYKKNSQIANENYIIIYDIFIKNTFSTFGIELRGLNNLTTDSFYKISFMEVGHLFNSRASKIPNELRLLFSNYFTFTMTSNYSGIFKKYDIYCNNFVTCIRANWKTKELPAIKKNIVNKLILQGNKHIKCIDGNSFKCCQYLDTRDSKVRSLKNFNKLKLLIISLSEIADVTLDDKLLHRYNKGHLKILTSSLDDTKLEYVKSSDIPTENYLIEQWIISLSLVP